MIIGIPKEIKPEETRAALVPHNVPKLIEAGHRILVQSGAGSLAGFPDDAYRREGAEILFLADDVWEQSELIWKIKEPQVTEEKYLRNGLILFSYLHLESRGDLVSKMQETNVIAIAMEKVEADDGTHVLYPPMSEITGRLAVIKGANLLLHTSGGSGVLLGAVPHMKPGKVLIIGGGSVGSSAAATAAGLGAEVLVYDINPNRVRLLNNLMPSNVTAVLSSHESIEKEMLDTDLVIGAVLISRKTDPHIITREMVEKMKPGSVIVDTTVGFGGYIETSTKATTPSDPVYRVHDVIHYSVPNMPAEVPQTASIAFSDETLPYGLELAGKGIVQALRENTALRRGVNVMAGQVTYGLIAETFKKPLADIEKILVSQ